MRDREDEAAVGNEDPGDLPDRPAEVLDVHQGHVGDDEVERAGGERGEMARVPHLEPDPPRVGPLPRQCPGDRRTREVDPHDRAGPAAGEPAREVAVAAGELEDPEVPDLPDHGEQRRIDQGAVPQVPRVAGSLVPPRRHLVPAPGRHRHLGSANGEGG